STWALTGTDLGKLAASRLVLDPLHPSVLYAAMNPTAGSQGLNSTGGIYRSTDGGATWTLSLGASSPAAGGGCTGAPSLIPWVPGSDIAVSNSGGTTTVYAALGTPFGCTADGIYKSTDNGQTWTRLTASNPSIGRIALATAPSNPSIIYAAVEVADPGQLDDGTLQGVYQSTDGGTTWPALALPNDL